MEDNSLLDAVIVQARGALRAGRPAEACDLLRAHQHEGQDDGAYLALMGAACCMAGHPEDGVAPLERALEIAPGAPAHFNLGQAYQLVGRIEDARACYGHALTLAPGHAQAVQALQTLPQPQPLEVPAAGAAPAPGAAAVSGATLAWTPPPLDIPKGRRGPRTAEQIAMDEWAEEEKLRLRRKEFIKAGVIYGIVTGAILFIAVSLFLQFLSGVTSVIAGGGGEGGGFLAMMFGLLIQGMIGAVFGSVVGLVVAWRNGGAFEGVVAGALFPILIFQVLFRLFGGSSEALTVVCIVFGITGAFGGAIIGWATAASIQD